MFGDKQHAAMNSADTVLRTVGTMAHRPFPFLASVILPVVYILALPFLSSVQIGVISQPSPNSSTWCSYTVSMAMPRDVISRSNAPNTLFYSISGFITSPAAVGVFATLCAPGLSMLYTHPVVDPTTCSTITLVAFYFAWTLFLGTPYLAFKEMHDVYVRLMFFFLVSHFTVQYIGIRRAGMKDVLMLVALLVLVFSCIGIVTLNHFSPDAPIYWFELVAIASALSFTPVHAWRVAQIR